MARRYALSVLRTRCLKRADAEGNLHLDATTGGEVDSLISEVYGELYQIVNDGNERYVETSTTITATGAASYDEPDDCLETIGIDLVGSDGSRTPLRKLEAREREDYAGLTGDAEGYMLIDNQVYLYPNPSSGTYGWLYVQQSPDLTDYLDDDEVDVHDIYGEIFLVNGVAALIKSKSESDMRPFLSRQEIAREKLLEQAIRRTASDPHSQAPLDECDFGTPVRRRLPYP